MLIQTLSTLLPAQATPQAVVLWVQTGCSHCHAFFERGYKVVAEKTRQQAQMGEAPDVRFFVLDAASGPFAEQAANEAGIEETPTVTAYRDGAEVGRLKAPSNAKELGTWLVGVFG